MTESNSCFICGTNNLSRVITQDYRFGEERAYQIFICQECGGGYTFRDFTDKELFSSYERNYCYQVPPAKGQLGKLQAKLGRALRLGEDDLLEAIQGTVLDFGAGQGALLRQMTARGCRAYGTDFSPEACANLAKAGFDVCTIEDIESGRYDGYFDTIVLSQVFEHLNDPQRYLALFHRLLKPRGALILALPNLDSIYRRWFGVFWSGYHAPYHLYHYSARSLNLLLSKENFKCSKVWYSTPFNFTTTSVLNFWRRHRLDGTNAEALPIFRFKVTKAVFALAAVLLDLFVPKSKKDCLYVMAEIRD